MTWLFSLYWLGVLAVAGPVVFHMWRRTPRGERPFSTLMFLAPSPPRITSRSRIEHWILMLLRVSVLFLLAFAFTRPLWRTPRSESEQASNEQLLAVLVDTSASMQREGLWDDLIRQVDERLTKLPPDVSVALYRFDRKLVPVASFHELKLTEPTVRREIVRSRLMALQPTWESTRIGESLVGMATVLQEAQTERSTPAPQRIWLASDLQSGAETVALQGYEWPNDLPVEVIVAHPLSASNAGLQVVDKNSESTDELLRVRVTNSADSTKDQFTLRWDSDQSPQVSVYVPPGQSRVLVPPQLPEGAGASSLILIGDDQDFDNRVYIAETAPQTQVVVYCGIGTPNDAEGQRFYLDRVFSSSYRFQIEQREWRETNTASAEQQPALVILVQPEPEAESFVRRYLKNGGTVLIAGPSPEAILASINLCGRQELTVTEASVPKYAMLGEIDFTHPIFSPFAESQFSDFTGIRFWKHRIIAGLIGLDSQADGDRVDPAHPHDRILARFDDGDPAIIDLALPHGRVIVFAAGWQPADSQFARSSKFPMLLFRLMEYSTGTTPRPRSQSVGSALAWPVTSRMESAMTGTARLPDDTELKSLPIDRPFFQTDKPGLYSLGVPGRTEQIAVNLDADESRTAPLTVEQLEGFGLKLKARERSNEQQRQRDHQRQLQLVELEQSQKLWQSLLIAVTILLLTETFLSGLLGSRNTKTDQNAPAAA